MSDMINMATEDTGKHSQNKKNIIFIFWLRIDNSVRV